MEAKLQELKAHLVEVDDLESVAQLLDWDQATYMPPEGASARARQIATVSRLAHAKSTDPAIGTLLEDLRPYEESLPFDSAEASLVRVARRGFERAIKVPSSFVGRLSGHTAASYNVWAKARPENNFAAVQPYLEKTLELSREMADFFPGYERITDPLIDFSNEGMKTATIQALFSELRGHLVPIAQAITAQIPADDACLHQDFPETQQVAFGLDVIKRFGFSFERGRQDKSPHPFMTGFSINDVRITTRVNENDLSEALFSLLHESGHAMYAQGVSFDFEGTPLAGGTASGVHESQSRLWENLVGRSREFWTCFYPELQKAFPDQLRSVSLDTFYRAINKVERSLIRTDADEVTYDLHIMLRCDLELALLEGRLAVRDLPEAWRERYSADLGVEPPDDKDGVLQDVHWYTFAVGGSFQGYTLGNILGAQFFETALQVHPEIPNEIQSGKSTTLRAWLTENIYRHGSKYTTSELVERVTGRPISIEPYLRYLRRKYGELYEL